MPRPTTRSMNPSNVPIPYPISPPKRTIGASNSLAQLQSFLRPDDVVVKGPRGIRASSVGNPWKVFLVTSKPVEKQLKDHEDNGHELLTSLGIAKQLTNPSIFVNEEIKLVRGQYLALQLLEIVQPQPKVTLIKAKDWPNSSGISKNITVQVGDETLGAAIRHLATSGNLLVVIGATKFVPESEDEHYGLAVFTDRLERISQSVYIFKRGENITLSPFTMPHLPTSLKVSQKLTLCRFGQSVYRATVPDPEPELEIATKLIQAPEKKAKNRIIL